MCTAEKFQLRNELVRAGRGFVNKNMTLEEAKIKLFVYASEFPRFSKLTLHDIVVAVISVFSFSEEIKVKEPEGINTTPPIILKLRHAPNIPPEVKKLIEKKLWRIYVQTPPKFMDVKFSDQLTECFLTSFTKEGNEYWYKVALRYGL